MDKPCKYLVGNKIKSCRIYANRLGTKTFKGNVCVERKNFKYNIPGCPYNKEGLQMLIEK